MALHLRVAALASLALAFSAASGPTGLNRHDPSPQRTTIDAASPAWTRRIEWGLDRFRTAGLSLPPLAITVHQDKAPCGGNTGRYRASDRNEIHLCASSDPDSGTARLITLHELAHAWAETQLSTDRKDAFLRLRALDTWVDRRVPPHEWGAEHAAEVVSWGLMDEMVNIIRIHDAEPAELSSAFDLLVEGPPLWARDTPESRRDEPDLPAPDE